MRYLFVIYFILNLFNNSYDAICEEKKPWVKLTIDSDAEKLLLIFSDCGTGIPDDIKEKILQPFFTTKETGKGTGLGLSISKGIIEMHKGRFYIDSEKENTTFVIEIPKVQ